MSPQTALLLDSATQNVEVANAQLAIAQARLDELRNPDANNVASNQASVASATAQYDAAVARHEALLLGASAEEIAAAEADLASAVASLETLRSGPQETDITIHETRFGPSRNKFARSAKGPRRCHFSSPLCRGNNSH